MFIAQKTQKQTRTDIVCDGGHGYNAGKAKPQTDSQQIAGNIDETCRYKGKKRCPDIAMTAVNGR